MAGIVYPGGLLSQGKHGGMTEPDEPPTSPPPQDSEEKPGGGQPPHGAFSVMGSDLVEGDAAEIVRLRRERDDLQKRRKALEVRTAELEDENRRLKTTVKPEPGPAPEPVKRSWLNGSTFFDLGGAD